MFHQAVIHRVIWKMSFLLLNVKMFKWCSIKALLERQTLHTSLEFKCLHMKVLVKEYIFKTYRYILL